ncbi:hypothetical protein Hanom_Chr14g01317311 [Helianthus anomalus]
MTHRLLYTNFLQIQSCMYPFLMAGLGVGEEDHRLGPGISRGTFFFMKKTRYVYVKYFFNSVHLYKHQHSPLTKLFLYMV